MTQDVSALYAIAEQRELTEEEARDLPAMIADDGGDFSRIPITDEQVTVLKAKGLVYYCGYCTKTSICIAASGGSENEMDESVAREYHTNQALCDFDDPEAYLASIIAESKGKHNAKRERTNGNAGI